MLGNSVFLFLFFSSLTKLLVYLWHFIIIHSCFLATCRSKLSPPCISCSLNVQFVCKICVFPLWFIFSVNVYLIMWYFTILSYAYPYRIFTLIRLFDIFPSVKFRWDLHDVLQTWVFLAYIIYYECVKPKVKFIYRYMPNYYFCK